jgi:uncharacterized protein YbaP (TraB family)
VKPIVFILLFVAGACGNSSPSSAQRPVEESTPVAGSAAQPAAPPAGDPEPEIPDFAAAQQLADEACPQVTGPYFYRVEKAGKVSHLLGTRHVGVSLDKMPKLVKDTLLAAKLVVFETAPGDEGGAGAPEYQGSLAEELGPDLWGKYKAIVGDDLAEAVDRAGPAMAVLAMTVLFEHKAALLDDEIETFVQSARIPTAGLESAEFQDRLLAELLDIRLLKATIAGTPNRATLRKDALEDLAEFCAGTDDDPGMDARSREQLRAGGFTDAEIDTLDKKLLDDRNDRWMPQLDKLLRKGKIMVVVGSDHLIGKRGLVEQLTARGYKTERVRP